MQHSALLHAFLELRKRELSLGLTEYFTLLTALHNGFGIQSRADFIRTCKILWAKSLEQQLAVEEVLQTFLPPQLTGDQIRAVIAEIERLEQEGSTSRAGLTSTQQPSSVYDEPLELDLTPEVEKSDAPFVDETSASEPSPSLTIQWQPAKPEGRIADPAQIKLAYDPKMDFTVHLPVSRRQMMTILRSHRRMGRTGMSTELDVEATVQHIYREGMLIEPVMKPPRSNQARLTLLVDSQGSMLPFVLLTEALLNALERSRMAGTQVFYFHDVPGAFLFRDANLSDGLAIERVLLDLRGSVLILSDGGAARRGWDSDRAERTKTFIQSLRALTPNVVWVNPVPPVRWAGTTAEAIRYWCRLPMFYFNQAGLEGAIRILRGQATL